MMGRPLHPPPPLLLSFRGPVLRSIQPQFIRPASSYVQNRARNLAARHWDLVRAHSPSHPATRHVIDHESTKAAIADHTGLRTTTDAQPISVLSMPKEVYIRGVKIPVKPKPPESDECCMSGCAVCVYDLYLDSLSEYKQLLLNAKSQLRAKSIPSSEWPHEIRNAKNESQEESGDTLDSLDLDPSMKAFLLLEKKLGQKKL